MNVRPMLLKTVVETYVVVMAELNGSKNLIGYFSNKLLLQTVGIPFQIVKYSVIHKLENKIQLLLTTEVLYQVY